MEIIKTKNYMVYQVSEEDLKTDCLFGQGEHKKQEGTFYRAAILPHKPATALMDLGFFFADRTILLELSLDKMDEKQKKMIRFDSQCTDEFDEEIYNIAREAFTFDRRFHLRREYDMDLAGELVCAYIDQLKKDGCFLVRAYHKQEMIGFNIFKLQGQDLAVAENLLGAVRPRYQRTGAAVSLYVSAANYLLERGAKRLCGRISTANTPSLNLHLMLGNGHAVLKDPMDIYIC